MPPNQWFKTMDKSDLAGRLFYTYETIMKGREKNEGYVYLLQCGKYHKIGKAKYLAKRISAYKTHNPYKTNLVSAVLVGNCSVLEESLHSSFSSFRHFGEWYRFTDGSLEVVLKIFSLCHAKE